MGHRLEITGVHEGRQLRSSDSFRDIFYLSDSSERTRVRETENLLLPPYVGRKRRNKDVEETEPQEEGDQAWEDLPPEDMVWPCEWLEKGSWTPKSWCPAIFHNAVEQDTAFYGMAGM